MVACKEWVVSPTTTSNRQLSASRVQAVHYLSLVLSIGATLFAFDCAGSGLSDGEVDQRVTRNHVQCNVM